MEKSKKQNEQQKTKLMVIQALRLKGAVSRIQLAAMTGLSRATISIVVTELAESGLVKETEVLQSTGGRPPIALQFCHNTHAVLGADYENQEWTIGAFDLIGNPIAKRKVRADRPDPEAAIDCLIENIQQMIQSLDIRIVPLLGLGMPGLVDTDNGTILSASDIGWHHVEIGNIVSKRIGWPTVVLNRHRARGLAECRYGAGQEMSHMIYVGVGTGVAAGLFHNHKLISGALGGAGELMGHITIEPDGPLCPCGNSGCLQVLSAETAIELEYRRLVRAGVPSMLLSETHGDIQLIQRDDICQAADQGDEAARSAVNEAAEYMGIALATMVNLFNPEAIILGGPIPRACKTYTETSAKVMRQRAMSPIAANIVFKTEKIGELSGALGAANFALDQQLNYNMLLQETPLR